MYMPLAHGTEILEVVQNTIAFVPDSHLVNVGKLYIGTAACRTPVYVIGPHL